jgi:hypothetical protein
MLRQQRRRENEGTYSCETLVFVIRIPSYAHDHGVDLAVGVLKPGCRRRKTGARCSARRMGDDAGVAVVDASERELGEGDDRFVG